MSTLEQQVQEKLDLEHRWAKQATKGQTEEMKWTSIRINDLKKQIDNVVEQQQKFSIAS